MKLHADLHWWYFWSAIVSVIATQKRKTADNQYTDHPNHWFGKWKNNIGHTVWGKLMKMPCKTEVKSSIRFFRRPLCQKPGTSITFLNFWVMFDGHIEFCSSWTSDYKEVRDHDPNKWLIFIMFLTETVWNIIAADALRQYEHVNCRRFRREAATITNHRQEQDAKSIVGTNN